MQAGVAIVTTDNPHQPKPSILAVLLEMSKTEQNKHNGQYEKRHLNLMYKNTGKCAALLFMGECEGT